jgi:hypothetical protein
VIACRRDVAGRHNARPDVTMAMADDWLAAGEGLELRAAAIRS